MKKNNLFKFLFVILFSLSSCNNNQNNIFKHEHRWNSGKVIKEVTCTENGETRRYCIHCGNEQLLKDYAKGHEVGSVAIVKYPSATENGIKEIRCSKCKEAIRSIEFVNNAYTYNGKLSVKGSDLVNKSGRKVQLYGLSTHGMNWFGKYANIDTIASLPATTAFDFNLPFSNLSLPKI